MILEGLPSGRRGIAEAEQALVLSRVLENHAAEANAREILGRTLQAQGELSQAEQEQERALELALAQADRGREISVRDALVAVYAAQGRTAEVRETWNTALSIAQDRESQEGLAEIRWVYGQFLVGQGERERGIALMAECVAYEQRIGHAKADEHAALVDALRGGGELPSP